MMLVAGCTNIPKRQTNLPSIVFPYQWVGNIDKVGFNELSGICWHSNRKTLFVVGDEGDVCEIKTDGILIKQKRLRFRSADFEGITHNPLTGLLYIAVEGTESIIEINPETFEVLREFFLPRTVEGKTVMKSGGQGIEALTFVSNPIHPEGGIFYIANQASSLTNKSDISAVFKVEIPLRSKTKRPRILDYFIPGIIDLSGLHYDPITGHIFIISDTYNIILEYSPDYRLLSEFAFPGDNQEGITVDDAGFMYIAQDSGGIVKLKWIRNE